MHKQTRSLNLINLTEALARTKRQMFDLTRRAERASVHSVRIGFVSGYTIEVHCAIKSTARATWELDADTLVQTLLNTDAVKLDGGRE